MYNNRYLTKITKNSLTVRENDKYDNYKNTLRLFSDFFRNKILTIIAQFQQCHDISEKNVSTGLLTGFNALQAYSFY